MAKPEQRRNAADPNQVRRASEKEESIREQEINDLVFLLSTEEGKRFLWRLLAHCKTFASVWSPNALIHYASGQQDVGHFILKEIVEAKPDALLDMMKANSGLT